MKRLKKLEKRLLKKIKRNLKDDNYEVVQQLLESYQTLLDTVKHYK